MAERRMFSKSVINSGRFLMMPISSRLLYYDLGMAADDDGIVEAFSVLRTTGATEDDLRVLCSKQYITILNNELVSYINDWKRNNLIRGDRYQPSAYKELLVKITAQQGLPTVNQWETEDSIGKDSIGKDSIGISPLETSEEAAKPQHTQTRFQKPSLEEVKAYCEERNNTVDPERFYDFYESKGWMIGKNKMKDWRSAIRMWEREPNNQLRRDTNEHSLGNSFDTDDFFQAALQRSARLMSEANNEASSNENGK